MVDQPTPVPAPAPAAAPAPAQAPVQPTLQPDKLTQWPGAFGAYKYSRAAMVKVIWPYLVIVVAYIIITTILQTIFGATVTNTDANGMLTVTHTTGPVGTLLNDVIGLYVGIVTTILVLNAAKGVAYSADVFKSSLGFYLRYLGLTLLSILTFIGLALLLVVPLFIFGPRLVLAPYFLIDQNMGVIDAYKASWNQSKGNVGKLYGIFGASILMTILCIVLIGFYFLLMYAAVGAVLYFYIKNTQGVASVQQAPPVTPTATPTPTPTATA